MKNYIKDSSGRILGWIKTYNTNFLAAYTADGKCVGKYDTRNNKTYDASGRLLYTGNMLTTLI